MAGVENLMVVHHPLAANQEDLVGPGIVQRTNDFFTSFGVTPEAAYSGAAVGLVLGKSLGGTVKGLLIGSLFSMGMNWLNNR